MKSPVILALRALLVVLALGALTGQIALVVAVAVSGVPPLGVVYAVVAVAAIACVQVGLVALWVLLSMVRRGAIFDERAFRWVDVISVAGLLAAVLVAGLLVHAGEVDDSPGLGGIGLGVGIAGAAFALLMVVMRGLLRNATLLRHELDEVV